MTTANVAIPARDVEQVLREGGLSRFHKKAILVTGAAWTFVAMEILLVGFVAPIFAAQWGLNGRMQGLVNSAALAGSLCGSLALGRLADRIGRRTIFQYSILWYAIFTAVTALSWGPWSVMTFRFLAGLGLGGMLVVDPSMLTEYLPPQRRGRLLVFLDFWWPVGTAAGDLPVVDLHRARHRRRQQLALALPGRLVPGAARVRRAAHAAREPVLPRAARPQRRGGRGADRDHRQAGRAG